MTDLEKLKAVFTELGVDFTIRDTTLVVAPRQGAHLYATEFVFNSAGQLTQHGIWGR